MADPEVSDHRDVPDAHVDILKVNVASGEVVLNLEFVPVIEQTGHIEAGSTELDSILNWADDILDIVIFIEDGPIELGSTADLELEGFVSGIEAKAILPIGAKRARLARLLFLHHFQAFLKLADSLL
jgi:hypothetical protein